MFATIAPYILPFLTLLLGFFSKGIYERRIKKASSDGEVIDKHSELYDKMQKEFIKLHNEIIEYQREVNLLRKNNLELQSKIDDLLRETTELKDSVNQYKQALDGVKNKDV